MMMRKQSNWIEEKSLESMKTRLNRSSVVFFQPPHRSNSFSKRNNGGSIVSTNNNSMITLQPFLHKQPSHELRASKSSVKIEYNAISVADRKIIRGVSSKIHSSEKLSNEYSMDTSSILSQMKVTRVLIPIKSKVLNQSFTQRQSSESSLFTSFGKANCKSKEKPSRMFTNRSIAYHHRQLALFKEHLNGIIEKSSHMKKSQFFHNKNIKGFICLKNGNKRQTNKCSTLLIKTNVPKENVLKRLLLNHESSSFISTIRMQSLNWLWANKSLLLERLILSYKNYRWFLEKHRQMTSKIMCEFMSLLKMDRDEEFINGVFMIFDAGKTGTINIQEVFLNFILTSSSSYEINVSHILELLLDDNRDISVVKLIELLRFVIPKASLRKLAEILNSRFCEYELSTPRVSFNVLYSFLINDETCVKIIKSKMISYTQEDSNLEQEIVSACVSNMKNSLNYLSDHSTKMFRENDFNKFNQVLSSIQMCKNYRKRHRYISSEEGN